MKKHFVTIRNKGRLYMFLVNGTTDSNGKTRVHPDVMAECMRNVCAARGETITIG